MKRFAKHFAAAALICMLTCNLNAQTDLACKKVVDSLEARTKRILKQHYKNSGVMIAPLTKCAVGIIIGAKGVDTTINVKMHYLTVSEWLLEKIEKEAIKNNTQFVNFISFSYKYPSGKQPTVFNFVRDGNTYKLSP